MAGKGTYLGGSTIISFNKKSREEGWEPAKVVLSKRKLTQKELEDFNKNKKIRRNKRKTQQIMQSLSGYAKRSAEREIEGAEWPTCPKKVLTFFQGNEKDVVEAVRDHPSYRQVMTNPEAVRERNQRSRINAAVNKYAESCARADFKNLRRPELGDLIMKHAGDEKVSSLIENITEHNRYHKALGRLQKTAARKSGSSTPHIIVKRKPKKASK